MLCTLLGPVASRGLGLMLSDAYKVGQKQPDIDMRKAQVNRKTSETEISVAINLDGTGQYDNQTGVGFFDHMLDQLSRHSFIDITMRATGDTHIDYHHTVEDCGIALGQALIKKAFVDTAVLTWPWMMRRFAQHLIFLDGHSSSVTLILKRIKLELLILNWYKSFFKP